MADQPSYRVSFFVQAAYQTVVLGVALWSDVFRFSSIEGRIFHMWPFLNLIKHKWTWAVHKI